MNARKALSIVALLVLLATALPAASVAAPGEPAGPPAGPPPVNAGAAPTVLVGATGRPLLPGRDLGSGLGRNAPSRASFLRPNGTLDLGGYRGSLDPRGYRLVSGPNEVPRFAQAPAGGDTRPRRSLGRAILLFAGNQWRGPLPGGG